MSWENFYLVSFPGRISAERRSLFCRAGAHAAFSSCTCMAWAKAADARPFRPSISEPSRRFCAWFGGTGYLLERYSNIWVYLGLFISMMSGLGGAFDDFLVSVETDEHEQPARSGRLRHDRRAGKSGQSHPPRRHGRIDLFASRHAPCGRRRAARTAPKFPRDTEVIVTRFEKGIAYVRRWDEINGEKFLKEEPYAYLR